MYSFKDFINNADAKKAAIFEKFRVQVDVTEDFGLSALSLAVLLKLRQDLSLPPKDPMLDQINNAIVLCFQSERFSENNLKTLQGLSEKEKKEILSMELVRPVVAAVGVAKDYSHMEGETALNAAYHTGNLNLTQYLLDNNVKMQISSGGKSPFHAIVSNYSNPQHMLSAILQLNKKIQGKKEFIDFIDSVLRNNGVTPFCDFCYMLSETHKNQPIPDNLKQPLVEVVKVFVSLGANPNVKDNYEMSPLAYIETLRKNNPALVKEFIEIINSKQQLAEVKQVVEVKSSPPGGLAFEPQQPQSLEMRVAQLEKEREEDRAKLQLMERKFETLNQQLEAAMRLIQQMQLGQSAKSLGQFSAIQSPQPSDVKDKSKVPPKRP